MTTRRYTFIFIVMVAFSIPGGQVGPEIEQYGYIKNDTQS